MFCGEGVELFLFSDIFLTCLEMLLKLAESWLICGYRFHQKDFLSQDTSQHRRNETINFCSTCGHFSAFLFVKVRGFLHHLPSFTLYPFLVVAMVEVVGQSQPPGVTGGHACETAEPQQDSGPTPSNPLKAKVDRWLEALALVRLT